MKLCNTPAPYRVLLLQVPVEENAFCLCCNQVEKHHINILDTKSMVCTYHDKFNSLGGGVALFGGLN